MRSSNIFISTLAIFVLAWEAFLTFGLTFSFTEHESFLTWAFLCFTTLLNIPAILCLWRWPRLSAYWLLINIAGSFLSTAGVIYERYSELSRIGEQSPFGDMFTGGLLVGMIKTSAMLWLPQLVLCLLLFRFSKSTAPAEKVPA